jgi:hypothetical protein|tara:strand:+ start:343 stop:456 length:114 start_codon:yes stop_codon:yes gene_type:complete
MNLAAASIEDIANSNLPMFLLVFDLTKEHGYQVMANN